MPTEAWECPSCTFNNTDDNAQECGMCASTRPRPIKRTAVAFASAAKEVPVAAQPPAPAITSVAKKPAAVRRPIVDPMVVPAIRPMATVLEIAGTAKADRGRRCEEHSCCGEEVLEEDVVVHLRREQVLVPNRLGKGYRKETAYTDNWVTDGQDRCRVGFLPRAYVEQGGLFDGVLCQVVSIGNAFDDDHNEQEKVKHACGYARAQVISPLNAGCFKIVIKFSKTIIIPIAIIV
jgi:hypothetical protein